MSHEFQAVGGAGLSKVGNPKARYPKLVADVDTIDFSGWPLITHRDVVNMKAITRMLDDAFKLFRRVEASEHPDGL
ncbi:MAG: hypothetical protein GEU77_17300 [Deltaproteobacteria bacterium]|nr:hypothetical protein [Deltaproteobacteria bacterium]